MREASLFSMNSQRAITAPADVEQRPEQAESTTITGSRARLLWLAGGILNSLAVSEPARFNSATVGPRRPAEPLEEGVGQ